MKWILMEKAKVHPALLIVACLWGLTLSGCGSEAGPPAGQVSGRVSLKGQPLSGGNITFHPVDKSKGTIATGEIGGDGSYTIQTVEPGDGARLGDYNVSIISRKPGPDLMANPQAARDSASASKPESLIPVKYEDPSTSGLTASIKKGQNTIPFDLD